MPTPDLSITLANQRGEVERLAETVDRFGADHHIDPDDVATVNLVLDELVLNIIGHAWKDKLKHQFDVRFYLEEDTLRIEIEDDGRPFNPVDAPPPNLDVPIEQRVSAGLGIFIARSFVNAMTYRREGNRNVLTVGKKVRRISPPA